MFTNKKTVLIIVKKTAGNNSHNSQNVWLLLGKKSYWNYWENILCYYPYYFLIYNEKRGKNLNTNLRNIERYVLPLSVFHKTTHVSNIFVFTRNVILCLWQNWFSLTTAVAERIHITVPKFAVVKISSLVKSFISNELFKISDKAKLFSQDVQFLKNFWIIAF